MTLIYLAHPIDYRTPGPDLRLWGRLAGDMRAKGWTVYDPEWAGLPDPDPKIQRINQAAIDAADALVAYLPGGSSSVGVPMEIQRAADRGIPTIVFRPEPSVALQAMAGVHQVASFDQVVYVTSEILLQRIRYTDSTRMAQFAGPGTLPTQAYDDDAGFDLYYHGAEQVKILPGAHADIPSGVAVTFPFGNWGMVVGRSSTFQRGLLVNVGIIDPGYRGELFAKVFNLSPNVVTIEPGERIAQIIPLPTMAAGYTAVAVERLPESKRGTNGFGSSGR